MLKIFKRKQTLYQNKCTYFQMCGRRFLSAINYFTFTTTEVINEQSTLFRLLRKRFVRLYYSMFHYDLLHFTIHSPLLFNMNMLGFNQPLFQMQENVSRVLEPEAKSSAFVISLFYSVWSFVSCVCENFELLYLHI